MGSEHARVTPHVAQNESNRRSAIDGRTTRHAGYGISQWKRKAIEQSFGWMKTVGLLHEMRTEDAGAALLGDLPGGGVHSEATGVSADGLVVVGTGETFGGTT